MATNVLLPQWGMNMEDGLLVKWLVAEGDTVEAGQPLVEIETAKIESELESPVAGVVAHVMASAGTTANVGDILLIIGEPGESVERPASSRPAPAPRPARRERRAGAARGGRGQVTPVARRLAAQNDIDLERVSGSGPNGRITENDVRQAMRAQKSSSSRPAAQVVPKARLLAKQNGIDLAGVNGTGPNGRILVADVLRQAQDERGRAQDDRQAGGLADPELYSEIAPLRGLRRTIAQRMAQSSRSTAPVTLTTEVDVTEAVAMRERLLAEWRQHRIRPLDLDLIVKATAASLTEHPRLNSHLAGDEVGLLKDVNVGVAMAVDEGLLVPVIKSAAAKSLLEIAREIRDLSDRNRSGKLSVDDMTGAGFTITSLSGYGIDAFTPIIDPPQVAILGVGRIVEKPAVHEGQVAVRSLMFLSLTFDHRALDGVPAAEFLRTLASKLHDPAWMAD